MDYDQYISDATRSESRIDEAKTERAAFINALNLFTLSGQILDLYKRQIFYGKDYDRDQMAALLGDLHDRSSGAPDTGGKEDLCTNTRVLHAAMGFATESGEILEPLIESLEGADFDNVNFMEEIGDLNWYQAIALDETGLKLEDICDRNIAKLKARFPEKFTEQHAIERDLDQEREILEGSTGND